MDAVSAVILPSIQQQKFILQSEPKAVNIIHLVNCVGNLEMWPWNTKSMTLHSKLRHVDKIQNGAGKGTHHVL